VSVTKFKAGDAYNVIPAEVSIGGTIRCLTDDGLNHLRQRLIDVAKSVAQAHRCSIEGVQFMPDHFPPTVNNPELWDWIQSPEAGIRNSVSGPSGFPFEGNLAPSMGSEDFSFYTHEVPGAFILLGQGTGKGELTDRFPTNVTVHSPRFNLDEDNLERGVALHAQLATRSLRMLLAGERVPSSEL